jgi:hypothetical protein
VNKLGGTIPSIIATMTNLQRLDLLNVSVFTLLLPGCITANSTHGLLWTEQAHWSATTAAFRAIHGWMLVVRERLQVPAPTARQKELHWIWSLPTFATNLQVSAQWLTD